MHSKILIDLSEVTMAPNIMAWCRHLLHNRDEKYNFLWSDSTRQDKPLRKHNQYGPVAVVES